jgi:hypothetical protein
MVIVSIIIKTLFESADDLSGFLANQQVSASVVFVQYIYMVKTNMCICDIHGKEFQNNL